MQLIFSPEGGWREVRVAWPGDSEHPTETDAEWQGELPSESLRDFSVGQRTELHHTYATWLHHCVAAWAQGRLLTVDYGHSFSRAQHREQPRGTLRAYCHHLRLTGVEVYQRFGQQDLTADVNFDDLKRWGERAGLTNLAFITQAEFLRNWLSPQMLGKTDEDPALAFLLNPQGAGEAFKVLEQRR